MRRFSCFNGHLENHKHKKSAQPSFETMVKMLQLNSQNHTSADYTSPALLHDIYRGKNDTNCMPSNTDTVSSQGWRSGDFNCEYVTDSNKASPHSDMGNIRRSLSVGFDLNRKTKTFDDNTPHDGIDQVFSCYGSNSGIETAELSAQKNVGKMHGTVVTDPDVEAPESLTPCSSDLVNHESIFSIPDLNYLEKEFQKYCLVSLNHERTELSDEKAPNPSPSRISRSNSLPNIQSTSPTFSKFSSRVFPHIRSSEDLLALGIRKQDVSANDVFGVGVCGVNKDDSFYGCEKFDIENSAADNFESLSYVCSTKDWIIPKPEEMGIKDHGKESASFRDGDHIRSKNFKIKRIEDWVVDLQHLNPAEETYEIHESPNEANKVSAVLDGFDKVESKKSTGMEAANRYITSLNATASTVLLANRGLAAIPLLSAFTTLKVLNMSGNSIVKVTAGALPQGLHMLNLSKNKLSAIEGLRELSRLRVLDLSYNKISRIGHGLASCSSVKELYLAGNKISEVEGLHRLLKLAVLDLRFNKIATSKSIGQLAANYNSLQAISLEGNPAQKNVGDEQLKKVLQGLLPHLAYYNRQHIKNSTVKDSSDRSVRLGISGNQIVRGARSDHKSSVRHSVAKRSSHSSLPRYKGQALELPKQSRGRHGLLPSGPRTSHHPNQMDVGINLQRLRSRVLLHKSRSESNLFEV